MSSVNADPDRRTGRTTSRRLLALAYATMNPGVEVEFQDHRASSVGDACGHACDLRRDAELLKLPIRVNLRANHVFITCLPPLTSVGWGPIFGSRHAELVPTKKVATKATLSETVPRLIVDQSLDGFYQACFSDKAMVRCSH